MYRDGSDEQIRQLTEENARLRGNKWGKQGLKYFFAAGLPLALFAGMLASSLAGVCHVVHQKAEFAKYHPYPASSHVERDIYGVARDMPGDGRLQEMTINSWDVLDNSIGPGIVVFGIALFGGLIGCLGIAANAAEEREKLMKAMYGNADEKKES